MKKVLFVAVIMSVFLAFNFAVAGDGTATVENVGASSNLSLDDHSTSKVKNYDRQLPNPSGAHFPQTNGFFTVPTPDSSFRSVRQLIEAVSGDNAISARFSEGALEEMAKGGDVESHLQVIRGKAVVKRIGEMADGVRYLTIAYHRPIIKMVNGKAQMTGVTKPKNVMVTAMIDGEAKDADTNSFQVIGKCGLKVLKDGNNIMVVETEGAHRKVEAFGAGLGFYTVGGQVSDGGQTSGILGGGTGFAWNETGPEDRPWIQGYAGVIDGEVLSKGNTMKTSSSMKKTKTEGNDLISMYRNGN